MNLYDIRKRLQRLERRRQAGEDTLPPDFWIFLSGALPLDQAHPATRDLIAPMIGRRSHDEEDVYERMIAEASQPLPPSTQGE